MIRLQFDNMELFNFYILKTKETHNARCAHVLVSWSIASVIKAELSQGANCRAAVWYMIRFHNTFVPYT